MNYLTTQAKYIIATKTKHAVNYALDKESSHFDKVYFKLCWGDRIIVLLVYQTTAGLIDRGADTFRASC